MTVLKATDSGRVAADLNPTRRNEGGENEGSRIFRGVLHYAEPSFRMTTRFMLSIPPDILPPFIPPEDWREMQRLTPIRPAS